MKKIWLAAFMLLMTVCAGAVPAKRVWTTVTLEDGTQVRAMSVGDEHGHWLVTEDGRRLRMTEDGIAREMGVVEFETMKTSRQSRVATANSRRAKRLAAPMKAVPDGQRRVIEGKKKGLVILVNFSDLSFKSENNQKVFDERFNKVGYTGDGSYVGLVHDYFLDQSYGRLDLTFDVVGPVTVSQPMKYYGQNDSNGDDLYPCTMVIEALKLVDSQVNFSDYDWDGDGEVDQVFVVYAGSGEASTELVNTIWPHEWELSSGQPYGDGSGAQTMDGVRIDTYAVSCELSGAANSPIDGIGTACHEFSHCLGFPDLYDVDYSGGVGMDRWDLMDSGSYNGPNDNGEVPCGYSSYERWLAGWLDPVELSQPCRIEDMPALCDEPVAYVVRNDGKADEYYLLENRQRTKWFTYPKGHGLLILHVDYDRNAWLNNEVNDTKSHQRLTFVAADNSYPTEYLDNDFAGDPFPGSKNNTAFTNTSTPKASLFNANTDGSKLLNKPIEEIAETNGRISFRFMGGVNIGVPQVEEPADVSASSFTAVWSASENAESYTLEVKPVTGQADPAEAVMLAEDFSGFKSLKNTTSDISSQLDNYTKTKGWTGEKVFPMTDSFVKMGSSSAGGVLTTPMLSAPTTENATVLLNLRTYGSDTGVVTTVSLISASGKVIREEALLPSVTDADYVVSVEGVTEDFKVKIASKGSKKRYYINNVEVYDGLFSLDELLSSAAKMLAPTVTTADNGVITVAGIEGTSYALTGLTAEAYKYRVKAVCAEGESAWSAWKKVDLGTSGVNGITVPVTTSNVYYDLMGRRVAVPAKGLYINNGRKIIVR